MKSNSSKKDIAHLLGISKSQLSRELKNNSNLNGYYSAKSANRKVKKWKRGLVKNSTKINEGVKKYITNGLEIGWSPEQIAGRLLLERKTKLSDSAIYAYIKKDRDAGGNLYQYLRRKGRKKRDYNRKKASKSLIPNRVDIEERELIVESKSRIGDWEADTIVGKGKQSGLITLVERKTKSLLMVKIDNFKADEIAAAIINILSKNARNKVHTITFDNGLEFASHTSFQNYL